MAHEYFAYLLSFSISLPCSPYELKMNLYSPIKNPGKWIPTSLAFVWLTQGWCSWPGAAGAKETFLPSSSSSIIQGYGLATRKPVVSLMSAHPPCLIITADGLCLPRKYGSEKKPQSEKWAPLLFRKTRVREQCYLRHFCLSSKRNAEQRSAARRSGKTGSEG